MEVIDLTDGNKPEGATNLPARYGGVDRRRSDNTSSGRSLARRSSDATAGVARAYGGGFSGGADQKSGLDPRGRIGERLVARGIINIEQLNVALQEKKISGKLLGQVLIELGFISETQLVEFLADSSGQEVFDPKSTVFDGDALALLSKAEAKKLRLLPVSYSDDVAVFAVVDPYDIVAIDSIKRIVPKNTKVKYLIAAPAVLSDAIDAAYGYSSVIEDIIKELDSGKINPEDVVKVSEDQAYSHPIVRLVNALMVEAVKMGVSDLHFEPEENFVRVRYRLDGVLFTAQILHKKLWNGVSQRIKIMSKMNIADKLAPQDGRFNLNIGDREADFRVSSLPTVHGENIVLRVLDKSASIKPLEKLGFSEENLGRIRRAQSRPEGIIIVTGPTGSGKSTSLYSMINEINKVEVNIQTLEDPVEYSLPMIRQTPVREGILDFADGIKALLRQDPDVIFIGEIRDGVTGEMALKAAMTGHQVYTTLHTNDSFGAIPRLVDLGLKPGMIAGAIIAIFAQRLVRKLCPECKVEFAPDPDQCKILGIDPNDSRTVFKAKQGGCSACSGQGYKGRVAIAEILLLDEDLDEIVARNGTKVELKRTAQQKGFKNMRDDGILKVLDGITSFEEVSCRRPYTQGLVPFWHVYACYWRLIIQPYKYKAYNSKGRVVRGVITAASEVDLFSQLKSSGMDLVSCAPIENKSGLGGLSFFRPRIKVRDLIQFFMHLEQLQAAGVPLLDSLADVRDSADNQTLKDIMTDVHRTVSDGSSLSEALANYPNVFSNLYISLIKAGEDTGDLEKSFTQLIKYLKWVDEMQTKIRKATRYPTILLVVVILTITIMMGVVVPQIVGFIKNLGQELPIYTTALVATSEFFQQFWWAVLATPIILYLIYKTIRKNSESFAYHADSFFLRVPIAGPLIRKISVARYSQTFGALFSSGIDVIGCLRAAQKTVSNLALFEALETVEARVQAGAPLSQSFNASGEFPSLVIRMVKIGEESGNLTPVLMQVSEFYTKDVDEAVQSLITMIEPMLTALLGIMILWIAVGVFGPIYASFEHIQI